MSNSVAKVQINNEMNAWVCNVTFIIIRAVQSYLNFGFDKKSLIGACKILK